MKKLKEVLDPKATDYTREGKATALELVRDAAQAYITEKNRQHGKPDDPDATVVPDTVMGQRRYNAAKEILNICKKELEQMALIKKEFVVLTPVEELKSQQELLKVWADSRAKKEKSNRLSDEEFSCIANIIAFNIAYPNPEKNRSDEMLTYQQGNKNCEISREELHKSLAKELLYEPAFQRMRISCRTKESCENMIKKATEGYGQQLIAEYSKSKELMKREAHIQKKPEKIDANKNFINGKKHGI